MQVDDIRSFTGKLWRVRGERQDHETLFDAFCRVRDLSPEFLKSASIADLTPASKIPGILDAVDVIDKVIASKRKILLFGDFDLDGMSGTALLFLALRSLKAEVSAKLPSRSDGYGLSREVYSEAKTNGVDLIITVDCGSANGAEMEYGKSLGIDTIITDHHTIPEVPPEPLVFVHPHLAAADSDFYEITGAGVAFFLAKALLEHAHAGADITKMLTDLAELAILGTVADVGKLTGQNRVLLKIGLRSMHKTKHPGLRALLRTANIEPQEVTAETIAFFLAPRLNAAGRVAHPEWSLQILLGDPRYADEYCAKLEEFHVIRREKTDALLECAEELIAEDESEKAAFVLHHPHFFAGIAGLVAARIAERFHAPTVVLSTADDADILTASCRGPEDFHFAEALRSVSHLLEKFGGHQCAAGFSMRAENLEAFREAFQKVVLAQRGSIPPQPELIADLHTDVEALLDTDFDELLQAAPFGTGNPEPLLLLQNIELPEVRCIGKDQSHLAGNLGALGKHIPFIAFRFAEHVPENRQQGRFDALVHPEIRSYRGRKSIQLKIADLRESS